MSTTDWIYHPVYNFEAQELAGRARAGYRLSERDVTIFFAMKALCDKYFDDLSGEHYRKQPYAR